MSDINNHRTTTLVLHQIWNPYTRCHKHYVIFTVLAIILSPSMYTTVSATDIAASFNSSYLSATIKIVREIKSLNHSALSEYDRVFEYERLIYSCLSKITSHMEKCVSQFNQSFEQHAQWSRTNGHHHSDEKVRRYCCVQNQFKDCWTSSIRAACSELETRLSKWLPLQMLKDLRTDDRCRNYVLYPHKCRENIFSLFQILAFLLVVPFVAFSAIMLTIVTCKPEIAYRSLQILRTNQEIDV